jgi:hypothetical protein
MNVWQKTMLNFSQWQECTNTQGYKLRPWVKTVIIMNYKTCKHNYFASFKAHTSTTESETCARPCMRRQKRWRNCCKIHLGGEWKTMENTLEVTGKTWKIRSWRWVRNRPLVPPKYGENELNCSGCECWACHDDFRVNLLCGAPNFQK